MALKKYKTDYVSYFHISKRGQNQRFSSLFWYVTTGFPGTGCSIGRRKFRVNRNKHLKHATLPHSGPEMRTWLCMYIILLDLMKLMQFVNFLCLYYSNNYWRNSEVRIVPRGALRYQEGYQTRPKIHVKRVFYHNRARNVNRVSNSYKIDLIGYGFFGRSYVFRVLFHANFVLKGMIFGNLCFYGSFAKFCVEFCI